MSRLNEIKDEVAKEINNDDTIWYLGNRQIIEKFVDEVSKRYAKECCENAKQEVKDESQDELWEEAKEHYVRNSIIRKGVNQIFDELKSKFTIKRIKEK